MQKQHAQGRRGQRSAKGSQTTFMVKIDGHVIGLTREQIIANGEGWKKCHGTHGDTEVNSLSIKRMGGTIFLKDDKRRLSAFDANELAVALPEIAGLIKDATGTAPSVASVSG